MIIIFSRKSIWAVFSFSLLASTVPFLIAPHFVVTAVFEINPSSVTAKIWPAAAVSSPIIVFLGLRLLWRFFLPKKVSRFVLLSMIRG